MSEIIYRISYPDIYQFPEKRFNDEFIKKLDEFIQKEINGWLSVRCSKEYKERIF